jgi:hypothetical protein
MPPVFDILNYSEKALLHQEKNKKDQEKRDTDRNTMVHQYTTADKI